MNCSTPGFPALHYLLEFAQTHVHRVSDAVQLSRPLSPLSPPARLILLNLVEKKKKNTNMLLDSVQKEKFTARLLQWKVTPKSPLWAGTLLSGAECFFHDVTIIQL